MEIKAGLIGLCGIYCGACRLYILNKCSGCREFNSSSDEEKCPYYLCVINRRINSCGECTDFPCNLHYSEMAIYEEKYLEWKKAKILKV